MHYIRNLLHTFNSVPPCCNPDHIIVLQMCAGNEHGNKFCNPALGVSWGYNTVCKPRCNLRVNQIQALDRCVYSAVSIKHVFTC